MQSMEMLQGGLPMVERLSFVTVLIALFGRADVDPRLLATAAVAALRSEFGERARAMFEEAS